jgi:hypothetical protein
MGDATIPPPPNLMPAKLVYKKNSTSESKTVILEQDKPILRILPAAQGDAVSAESDGSTLNLTTPITASLRNRSGSEFTLVLKYRISAESAEQKEAWFRQLAALGVRVGLEEDDSHIMPRKETPGKSRRSLKKSRTESADTEPLSSHGSPVFHRGENSDSPLRIKAVAIMSQECPVNGDSSPLVSPRSPGSGRDRTRASSPRVASPRAHRRGESSPTGSRKDLVEGLPRMMRMSDSISPRDVSGTSSSYSASSSLATTSAPPTPVALEAELPITTPRLIRVHGARNNVHCSLVPRLASSMNKSDCYVLDDCNGNLYTWKGKTANMFAKSECSDIATTINQASYGGKSKIVSVQQALEPSTFWDQLLSGKGEIAESDTTGVTSVAKFFTIPIDPTSQTAGDMVLVEEGRTQFRSSLITDSGVIALDTGFEIIICDLNKDSPEPIPEQTLIDAARRYKRERARPLEVRITLSRGNPKHPLLAHFIK